MAVSLEQKVLEQTQELREKNQRIIEEQNQRQQFMTDIVHNLRNPLFALGGYMELLESQMDDPTAEQKKYVDLIENRGTHCRRTHRPPEQQARVSMCVHPKPAEWRAAPHRSAVHPLPPA